MKMKCSFLQGDFELIVQAFFRDNYLISALPYYKEKRVELFSGIKKHLQLRFQGLEFEIGFFEGTFIDEYFGNFYPNILSDSGAYSTCGLKDAFKNVPAIICAAGPSIQSEIDKLKALSDQAIIIGAGTGMNILNRANLFPHFGVGIDPHEASRRRVLANFAYEIPYFYIRGFNKKAFAILNGIKMRFNGLDPFGVDSWFNQELYKKDFPIFHSKISTTHSCLGVAQWLGCNPIVCLGLDLSYTEGQRYPEKVMIDHPLDQKSEHMSIDEVSPTDRLQVKNNQDKTVYTRIDWLEEATAYSQFASSYKDIKLINSTYEGLKIPGITFKPLDDVIENILSDNFDLLNWTHSEIQMNRNNQVSKMDVLDALDKWNRGLKKVGAYALEVLLELVSAFESYHEKNRIQAVNKEKVDRLLRSIKGHFVYEFFFNTVWSYTSCLNKRKYFIYNHRPDLLTTEQKFIRELQIEIEKYSQIHKFVNSHTGIIEDAINDFKKREFALGKEVQEPDHAPFSDEESYSLNGHELNIHDWAEKLRDKESITEVKSLEKIEKHFPNGKLKSVSFLKKGNLHGPSIFYSETGTVLAEGWYMNGVREGKNNQYYFSGKLFSVQTFLEGCLDGPQYYVFESGKLKSLISYKKGVLDGKTVMYYRNGQIKRELNFRDGKLEGMERMWAETGQLLLELHYEGNLPVGRARAWHRNGQVKQEVIYYDQPDKFDRSEWDEEGNLIKSELYMPDDVGKKLARNWTRSRLGFPNLKTTWA